MKNYSSGPKVKWNGAKETYDDFIDDFKDWMMYSNLYHFATEEIHPKIYPQGEVEYDELEVTSKTKRKKMAELINGHRKCIAKLRMSVPRSVINGFIDKSVTKEWPIGRLWIIFQKLKEAFYVDDLWAKRQLQDDMDAIVMYGDEEDPDNVFRRLENVQTRYARRPTIMPDCGEVLVQLVNGSSARYQNLYAGKLAEIRGTGKEITQEDIDSFQRLANVLYNTTTSNTSKKIKGKSKHSFKDADGKDIALFTAPTRNNGKSRDGKNGGKQKKFTGECYHCGKKGHKASQCWLKDKSQG